MRRIFACLVMALLTACGSPGPSTSSGPQPAPPPHRSLVAEGGMCGGFAGFQCEAGLTCQMDVGACHRIADAAGVCRRAPSVCPMIYQPVCGCDGKTYGNSCQALARGVSVAEPGVCKTE